MDRAERVGRHGLAEPLGERRHRRGEHEHLVAEAPARVRGPGGGVGRHHLEVDRVDPVGEEPRRHRSGQRLGHPRAAGGRPDVEIGDAPHPRAAAAGEGHADGDAVLLGQPAEPRLHDRADLGELGREVDLLVRRRRHLGLERPPELLEHGEVVERGAAHGHPCNLAPASSM